MLSVNVSIGAAGVGGVGGVGDSGRPGPGRLHGWDRGSAFPCTITGGAQEAQSDSSQQDSSVLWCSNLATGAPGQERSTRADQPQRAQSNERVDRSDPAGVRGAGLGCRCRWGSERSGYRGRST